MLILFRALVSNQVENSAPNGIHLSVEPSKLLKSKANTRKE